MKNLDGVTILSRIRVSCYPLLCFHEQYVYVDLVICPNEPTWNTPSLESNVSDRISLRLIFFTESCSLTYMVFCMFN